jgi:hypothetical protein
VRSQYLLAVGAAGLSGAVGVEGELPAAAVDAAVVMELTEQDEVVYRGLAVVFFVPQVLHVA